MNSRRGTLPPLAAGGLCVLGLLLAGCDGLDRVRALGNDHPVVAADASLRIAGGDPQRGRQLLARHACITCHAVPGERAPSAHVGPPLTQFGRRTNIGGSLPNQPEQLVRFIMNAPRELPGTGMPNLRVTEPEARDLAAFLYTLR